MKLAFLSFLALFAAYSAGVFFLGGMFWFAGALAVLAGLGQWMALCVARAEITKLMLADLRKIDAMFEQELAFHG